MSEAAREQEVFEAALAVPEAARDALIGALCGDDVALAKRVRRLLAADASATPLDVPLVDAASLSAEPRRIGAYEIVGRIGEGGMGVVYLADQVTPVRRRVALKVVKPGMDNRDVVARFEAERQALALMAHPNIARIIDGGATEDGRPYFVMEHVPGAPLIHWCDERRLDLADRLRLFVQVCDAVQHAHQKGVVHRDLKPSNVIVTELDGRPVPKVIDFGIAKAIGQPLIEAGAHTQIGHLIGTPDYMSPEQFEWAAHDVDTRADVYALGVLLYELLAGALPFDFQARKLRLAEIEAEIKHGDSPPPSVKARKASADTVAARARRDGADLSQALAGDLDWIIGMAMAKERERRYATARELAADIERHLANQPVVAGPPSGWYVLSKFTRRNLLPVSLLATTFVLTTAFAVLMVVQVGETSRERDRANLEAAKAREITRFLTDMFESADPESGGGSDVTARQILDLGARRTRVEFEGQPALRADLLAVMGRAYNSLGLYTESSTAYEDALAAMREAGMAATPQYFMTRIRLGLVDEAAGDPARGEREVRAALDEAERQLGPSAEATLALRVTLADFRRKAGALDEARKTLASAITAIETAGLSDSELHVQALLSAVYTMIDHGKLQAAEAPMADALGRARRLFGSRHPDLLVALARQAQLKMLLGKLEQAEANFLEALTLADAMYGPRNRTSGTILGDLGIVMERRGNLAGAIEYTARAHALLADLLGSEHRTPLLMLNNLAFLKLRRGDWREARHDLERALAGRTTVLGADHPETASTLTNLAATYNAEGNYRAAEPMFRRSMAILTPNLGANHWRVANAQRQLAEAIAGQGRLREAEREYSAAHDKLLAAFGPKHHRTRETAEALARLRARLRDK